MGQPNTNQNSNTGNEQNTDPGTFNLSISGTGPQLEVDPMISTAPPASTEIPAPEAEAVAAVETTPAAPETPSFNLDDNEPAPAESTALIDTIVEHTTKREPETKDPLLTNLSPEQLQAAELATLEAKLKSNSKFATITRNVLVSAVLIGFAMTGYFYFQFQNAQQTAFKANLTLSSVTEEHTKIEQQYNLKIYELITHQFDDLIWNSLELLQEYQSTETISSEKRKQIEANLLEIAAFSTGLTIKDAPDPKVARTDLLKAVPKELKNSNITAVMRSKKLHDQIGNKKELDKIKKLDDTAFANWLEELLLELKSPESKLLVINKERLLWSKIIKEIENATREVDPEFGSTEQFIEYSNYNFNARSEQITVTGQIGTEDSKTFSQIANLIDAIEINPYFSAVKTRSFTKNSVIEEITEIDEEGNEVTVEQEPTYQATLKLDFTFNKNGELPIEEVEA